MLRNIKIALWGLMAGLTALWLVANLPFPDDLNVMITRNLLLQLSGVIAIGAMSVAMILAIRPVWLEPWLGGLDKSYRLHKWLGIAGLVAAIAQLPRIDRATCRAQAEAKYSLAAMGERTEAWLRKSLA